MFESDKVHAELLLYIFLFPKCLMIFQINLKYGMDKDNLSQRSKDTCTACAGTMILEFAALSRLTGEHVFEVGVSEILLSSGPAKTFFNQTALKFKKEFNVFGDGCLLLSLTICLRVLEICMHSTVLVIANVLLIS